MLFHGFLSPGSTSLHRLHSFAAVSGLDVRSLEALPEGTPRRSFVGRILWRLRLPQDIADENRRLITAVADFQPDVVLVDNSRVVARSTLRTLRGLGVRGLVYYSPDDITAKHNLSIPLSRTLQEWDLFFTTKTFNVDELARRGVRRPRLIGNGFSPIDHRPLSPLEVGPEYEAYDLVFIGTCERLRANSIMSLARAGMRIVVFGNDAGATARWSSYKHPNITYRPAVYGKEYAKCLHYGKVALCFLRKANRDQITQRSIEIPAMRRPMLAEKTDEHDGHFKDGVEYMGFSSDRDLVEKAQSLLADARGRRAIATAGWARCSSEPYSNEERARAMVVEIADMLSDK